MAGTSGMIKNCSLQNKIISEIFLLFFVVTSFCYPQEIKISGTIKDMNSGEPLAYANIIIQDEDKGASTDLSGKFEFSIAPGSYELLVSYVGYKTEKIRIEPSSENIELDINLVATGVLLQEVSVYAATDQSSNTVSSISLQSKEMEEISSIFPDVFRSIQSLPGIAVNNEFSGRFNVRGGNYDENLVLVNGTQVYEPFHIKEADNVSIGIFNMDLMRKVNLITGGFSAQYGDRLSSVLNIEYREGNKERHTGSVTLSLTNLDAVIEGPLSSKANFILGLRKSYLEYVISMIDLEEDVQPSFYDIQGVFTYHLTDINKLQLKFIHAGDDFLYGPYRELSGRGNFQGTIFSRSASMNEYIDYNETGDAEYFSNLFDLQNTLFLSGSAFLNTSVSYYHQIDREQFAETEIYEFKAQNNNNYFYNSYYEESSSQDLIIKTWEAKSSLDLRINPYFDLKTGVSYINIKYEETLTDHELQNVVQNIDTFPDTISGIIYQYDNPQNIDASSYKLNAYIENIFQPGNLILNAGGRFDYFEFNRDRTFSPRLSASYRFNGGTNIRAAWGYFYQTPIYRQLAYSVPSDTNTRSQKAEHFVLSLEHSFILNTLSPGQGEDVLTLKAEGYYKKYSDLISSEREPEGNVIYSRRNDSKGNARGIDLYASLKLGSYYGWISYGLLFANEDLLNDGKGEFPRYTDQRHTISFVNDFDLGKQWSLNLRFTYGSGFAFTPYIAVYNNEDRRYQWVPGEKNSEHFPPYRRIDLRAAKEFRLFGLNSYAFLDVNNLLNFKNINGYRYRRDSNGNPYRADVELWPVIPTLGLTIKF